MNRALFPILFVLFGFGLTGCTSLQRFWDAGKGVTSYRLYVGEAALGESGRNAIYNTIYRHEWQPDVLRPTQLMTSWRPDPLGGRSRIVVNLHERGAGYYSVVLDVEYERGALGQGWRPGEPPVYLQEAARRLAADVSSALALW